MAFERFVKINRGYKPRISILTRGQIMFSKGAISRFGLDKYKFAIFYFDKDNNRIGMSFTESDNENGLIKLTLRPSSVSVCVRSFLQYYEIDYSKTKKYDINFDKKSKLFVVNL